ncbi:MAG: hypothetical protein JETCAE01_34500 [Anaerolineaceae bacterium]|nr:MAG: hypothetical protein JETCAE01_34500 [Anaerolineaceae bacterium]
MLREAYTPRGKTAEILDRAFELVESVPYQVSARWLFYRLLQEGYYSSKQDYANKFLKAVSAARHAFYKGWTPDTLADETRESIAGGEGWDDPRSWLEAVAKAKCTLDKWNSQPVYLECWYEARAMTDQFRHYTKYVTLRPMGGQPSIPYKWQAAKDIERAARNYKKPVVILYFGDLDPAGETISEVIERDISAWCDVSFEFVRCGLTEDQVKRYNVPENIEHPGAYQWEALTDEGARDIITENLSRYLLHDAFSEIEEREAEVTEWLAEKLSKLANEWEN